MILVIDNYDSFTYNLVQYIEQLGEETVVYRNDMITVEHCLNQKPDQIVLSPGPCTPDDAGICCELIESAAGKIPILGVCLGHQAIGQVFGGTVVRADRIMHGKTSPINHDAKTIFDGLPSPFEAVRYHSLLVERDTLPDCLKISAETDAGEIMGLRHTQFPIEGVQFHPESILTEHGKKLLTNFLTISSQTATARSNVTQKQQP